MNNPKIPCFPSKLTSRKKDDPWITNDKKMDVIKTLGVGPLGKINSVPTTHNRPERSYIPKLEESEKTKDINSYIIELKPLLSVQGLISHELFEECLTIYENNQAYYREHIDIENSKNDLNSLESWFILIIEPKDLDDPKGWKERELSKISKKISPYCDSDLYQYIMPVSQSLLNKIQQYHKKLFNI